jgi:protein O-mannosyl-transferase
MAKRKRKRKQKQKKGGNAPAPQAAPSKPEQSSPSAEGPPAEEAPAEQAAAESSPSEAGSPAAGSPAAEAPAAEAPEAAGPESAGPESDGSEETAAPAPEESAAAAASSEAERPKATPLGTPVAEPSGATASAKDSKPDKEGSFLAGFREEFMTPGAVVVILGLITALAYFYSLWVPFLFDDAPVVTRNTALWPGSDIFKLYEPKTRSLTYWTFALNFRLAHLNTVPSEPYGMNHWWSYHFVSILFHALNAGLLFLSVRGILLSCKNEVSKGFAHWVAFAGAAIWTLHPANTMAVAYIAQRFSLVGTALFLGSLLCYVNFRRRCLEGGDDEPLSDYSVWDDHKALAYLVGAMFLGGLTALAKENATVIPLFLLALELIVYRGKRWYLPAGFIFAGMVGLWFLAMTTGLKFENFFPSSSPTAETRLDYFLTQIPVTLNYLKLQFMPTDLTVEHQFPIVYHSSKGFIDGNAAQIVGLAALGHVLILALFGSLLWRGQRFIPLAIAGFYIGNLVESSFIPILDPMVDHRMYLPSLFLGSALCVAVVRGLPWIEERVEDAKPKLAFAVMGLCLLLACGTVARIHTWTGQLRIWEDTIDKRPWCARAYSSLGMEHLYRGEWALAVGPIETALELGPYHVEGWNNLGKAYLELERLGPAQKVLERGIQVNQVVPSPAVKFCLNNLGLIHNRLAADPKCSSTDRMTHWKTASGLLIQATRQDQLYDVAWMNLAQAEYNIMTHSYDDAVERKRAATSCALALAYAAEINRRKGGNGLSPQMQRWNIRALGEAGRAGEAFALAERMIAAVGDDPAQQSYKHGLMFELGEVTVAAHRNKDPGAAEMAKKSLPWLHSFYRGKSGGPGYVAYTLGFLYGQMGQIKEAVALLNEGLRLRPTDPRAGQARRELDRLANLARGGGPQGPQPQGPQPPGPQPGPQPPGPQPGPR